MAHQPDDDAGAVDRAVRDTADQRSSTVWILMEAQRWTITAALLGLTFLSLLLLGAIDPYELTRSIRAHNTLAWVFQGFLTAIITGVTLVVTISQLVLSQELGPVGDQRNRMEEALAFRRDVEAELDLPISPPDPASFLHTLLEVAAYRARAFEAAVDLTAETQLRDQVDAYTAGIVSNAESVSERLEDEQFGTFGVVSAALEFAYAERIHEGRRLQATHGDALSTTANDRLQDVLDVLVWFGPTREHVKTLYFQWELVNLSRGIMYAAVPALVVTLAMLLFAVDGESIAGSTLGISNLLWVTVTAVTVSLTPFMLLVAYVLRIGTVAQRTLAIGPFVLRDLD